jgi:hypothetical protein
MRSGFSAAWMIAGAATAAEAASVAPVNVLLVMERMFPPCDIAGGLTRRLHLLWPIFLARWITGSRLAMTQKDPADAYHRQRRSASLAPASQE